MKLQFYKMSGAGNDFVMIDNRRNILRKSPSAAAKILCRRKFSVGADGLILIEKSKKADFKMIYLNPDGSRAMCGNGARCAARFAFIKHIAGKDMSFETDSGILTAQIKPGTVKIRMADPKNIRIGYEISSGKKRLTVSSVNTGVPHAVLFVNDIEKCDVYGLGRELRRHKAFSPEGTNVNFVRKTQEKNTILVRTYERGVEDETLACGTGCTASAVIAGLAGIADSPVKCLTRSGLALEVSFRIVYTRNPQDAAPAVTDVYLQGPAEVTFTGEVDI